MHCVVGIDHEIPLNDNNIPHIEESSPSVSQRRNSFDRSSVVDALMDQTAFPSSCVSKPPKKRAKTQAEVQETTSLRPPELKCKKKKGSCNHEVVFGIHYNRKLFSQYKKKVRSLKSSVIIDPNYIS